MSNEVEVVVTPPGARVVLVVEKSTRRLLLFVPVYYRTLPSGVFDDPHDVVGILTALATRGHKFSPDGDPLVMYDVIKSILRTDLPNSAKLSELKRYIRGSR